VLLGQRRLRQTLGRGVLAPLDLGLDFIINGGRLRLSHGEFLPKNLFRTIEKHECSTLAPIIKDEHAKCKAGITGKRK
jgi:hypothetical protein